jgi:release factor glutamine methyltransferase
VKNKLNRRHTLSKIKSKYLPKITDVNNNALKEIEQIICSILNKDRSWLILNQDHYIPNSHELKKIESELKKLTKGMPLAHSTKMVEFYNLNIAVNKNVLIPRAETEEFIIKFTQSDIKSFKSIIDIGSGSGAIALAAKNGNKSIEVIASDIDRKALKLIAVNALNNKINIKIIKSNLIKNKELLYLIGRDLNTAVIANLPYLDKNKIAGVYKKRLNFEPSKALYAKNNGLHLIFELIMALYTNSYFKKEGVNNLYLEHNPEQFELIAKFCKTLGLSCKKYTNYYSILSVR